MTEIIPAILPKDYEELKNKIALVRGVVPVVQIDICDGYFVKNRTWPFSTGGNEDRNLQNILNEVEGMPFWEDIDFELDLMVADAISNFDIYTKLGAKRIVFHYEAMESEESFKEFIEGIDPYTRDSFEIGLSFSNDTKVEEIFPVINSIDFVQCMGIEHIGFQGQDFDKRVIDNIKKLKENFPDLIVSVDGAVSFKTAPLLVEAGAIRLVVGSAVFNTDDIIDTIENFRNI